MMLILLISLISQGRQHGAEKLYQSTASTSTFRYICNLHPYFHTSRCYLSRNIYVTIRVDMHPCVEWECVMCMDVFPSSVKKLGPFHPPSSVNLSIKMYKQPLHSQLSAVRTCSHHPPSQAQVTHSQRTERGPTQHYNNNQQPTTTVQHLPLSLNNLPWTLWAILANRLLKLT